MQQSCLNFCSHSRVGQDEDGLVWKLSTGVAFLVSCGTCRDDKLII